jgi:signal transduction histidine kinase
MQNNRSGSTRAVPLDTQATETVLGFLSRLLAPEPPVDQVSIARNAVELIAAHFQAERGYILLADGSGNFQSTFAAHSDPGTFSPPAGTYPATGGDSTGTVSEALTSRVTGSGRAILVQNAMDSKDFFGDPSFQRFNIKSAMCAPIQLFGARLGLIYLDTSEQNCQWTPTDLQLLELAGSCLGLLIGLGNLQNKSDGNQRVVAAAQVTLNIAHSIKNTLQLVAGATEVLDFGLRTNQIHRVKRSWDILKPNLERIGKLTLDMLDFCKDKPLRPGPCEFNKIVQSAVESLQMQLKQKQTRLHIRVDQSIPLVQLDADGIHQMTANLILNAVDIVDHDTGVVTVETKFCPEHSAVEISVADNGPHLTEQQKETVFLPMQSVRNKTGTGLGLAIAKKIAEQHEGRVEIESEPGKGTTFRVTLPVRPAGSVPSG